MPDEGAIIDLLDHPLRREILKLAVNEDQPLSPDRVADELGECLSNVSYHVRLLSLAGALVSIGELPARGAMRHRYLAAEKVTGEAFVREALGLPPNHGVEGS